VLIFLALNAGAVLAALLIAYAAGAHERTGRLLFFTLCGYLILVHSVVLAAGVVGRLAPGGAVVVLALVLAIALSIAAWRRRRLETTQEPSVEGSLRFTSVTLVCPMVAIITGGVWMWPHVAGPTRLWIWDDYTYHMVYPALWLRDHVIAAALPENAFTMQAWYPLSGSLVATWFMLPFAGSRADALAWVSLTGLLYAAIVAWGGAELLARLGCRPGAWAVPVVLFATSQRIGVMASSFSDADLAQAAMLFAAFVLAIPRGDTERAEEIRADVWYAALLAGIAVGVKVSAAPAVLVVVVMMTWRARTPEARWRAAGRIALIFVVGGLATGGYWYVRNVIATGNPLYPAAFLFWPGATFPHTTLRDYAQNYGVGRTISDALVVYLNWPRFHAWLAIIGLAALAVWITAARRTATRPQTFFACGTLAITAVTLLLLPSTPYSAGNGMTFVAGLVHWDSMRYVALLPILGWMALGALVDAGAGAPGARTLLAMLITLGALLSSPLLGRDAVLLAIAAVALAKLASRVGVRRPSRRATLATVAASLLVVTGGAAALHATKAAATAAAFYREPLVGAALAVLDRQPTGTRVAVFGDQWIYPMFGARHHLVPVRVDGNGRVARTPIGDSMKPGPLTVDPWTLRRNLATAYIGIVVIMQMPHPGRSPEWPPQATALENVRGTRLLYRDSAIGIWKLGD